MKKNCTAIKPFQKKRRRKRGRPPKYKNPVGRPKKFVDPVELHVILEMEAVKHLDSIAERLMARGAKICRGDIIRYCIMTMIGKK